MHSSNQSVAFILLAFSTVVVAINTFDLFAIFYLVAKDLQQDVSHLGLLAAAMTLGTGLSQIPGGIFAAKYGPKMVVVVGAALVGLAGLLTSFPGSITDLVILRFILGFGLGSFLPAAMIQSTSYIRKGSQGFSMGLIAGSNAAGGIVGLILWSILAEGLGWRFSMAIGRNAALIASLLLFFVLHKPKEIKSAFTIRL